MTYFFFVITFFVGILFYTLFPSDQIDVIEKPRSEQAITSFLAQHRGAVDFVTTRLQIPFLPVPESSEADADDSVIFLPQNQVERYGDLIQRDGSGNIISGTYPSEYVGTFVCTDDCDASPSDTSGFASLLICVDAVADNEIVSCTDANINNRQRVRKYVMTYGYDQEWWWEEFQGAALWREALWRRVKNSPDCGILDENVIKTPNSTSGRVISNVIKDIIPTPTDRTDPPYPRNTLVCLTPVNEPYVSDGLIFAIDSYLNQVNWGKTDVEIIDNTKKETTNAWKTDTGAFYHALLKDSKMNLVDNKWANLAATKGGTISDANTTVGASGTWVDSKDGIIFDSSQSITAPALNELGNSFTISYVISYNNVSDDQGTFGVITGGKGLMGGYGDSSKICFNVNPTDNSTSAICHTFEATKTVQVTYVVDYNRHALYINNDAATYHKDFDSIITPFNENDTVYIGKIKGTDYILKGTLYNFRIYNRALNANERAYNFDTDKARYNIE